MIYCFMREHNSLKLTYSKDDALYLIRGSYHFIISGLAVTFYSQIDKIMIGKFLDTSEVGIYTAAAAIATLWEFVPKALIDSARPLIIELREKDYDKYIRRFQQLLLAITVLSGVVEWG